jgi:hypothetical protein
VPSLGIERGPPGPLLGPMLLLAELPSLASSNWTEIGVLSSGLASEKVAARKARANSSTCRIRDGRRNGLRNRENSPRSPQLLERSLVISAARN